MQAKIVIIGGGPAGLAAAIGAYDAGERDILIIERESRLGGILKQCIHNGFGLHTFNEELTGPEYASRFAKMVEEKKIKYLLNTTVLNISKDKEVTALNSEEGIFTLKPEAIILTMGCRERPRGALNIPGYRPAGIYSAGTAQKLVNIEGYMPGKKVVILGSGDIGLIMARRMTLEGAEVKVVAELLPYSGGLKRNIVQCLNDFNIPLKLSHTVTNIEGKERVEAVTIAQVGPDRKPVKGTEIRYECDTLLLSCGLIPENELTRELNAKISPITNGPIVNESFETSVPGVFAAGNVLHVHDLVDFVSLEAKNAGESAAKYIKEGKLSHNGIEVTFEGGPRYTVPSTIDPSNIKDKCVIRFRVGDVLKKRKVVVSFDNDEVLSKNRQIMVPGEMEEIDLSKDLFNKYPNLKSIHINVKEVQ